MEKTTKDSMMSYRVKQHEVKGLDVLINIVDSIYHSKEVHTIRTDLLKLLNNPTDYTGLSQADIDKIFKPVKEDLADETDGGGYGAIKPVFGVIKRLMFEDEPEGKRIAGADEW